jgi:dihydroneopterin aldolase
VNARPERDRISLRGMRFHALIGVLPHEREHPQPLEVDLSAWISGSEILDYRALYDDVRAAVAAQPLRYLEDVAQAIATRALGHPAVERVRVAVRKPHVALGGPLDHAEVSITRERAGAS